MSGQARSMSRSETAQRLEEAVVGMYSRHPSPSRQDKIAYAARRMELRLHCCGVNPGDYLGKNVLDAGCGSGEYACWFASKGARVTAIDLSDGSLREAKEFAGANGLDVRFEKRSVLATGYPDARFDFVYCTGVLHHTPDPFAGFEELCRVLRPGGKVLISVYDSVSFAPRELRRRIAKAMGHGNEDRSTFWGEHLFPFTAHRLTRGKRVDSRAALYDYFGIPHQSRHSVGEVLGWLTRCDLEYCGSFPPLLLGDYPAMFAHDGCESVERRFLPRLWGIARRLGSGEELRRSLPGPFSRTVTQMLWLVAGIPMFCICGRKERAARDDRSLKRSDRDSTPVPALPLA